MRPTRFFTGLSLLAVAANVATAHAQADSVALDRAAKVRVQAAALGPGWHEGQFVTMRIVHGADEIRSCLSFAPTQAAGISGMTLNATDSLEVWVAANSTHAGADSTSTAGRWVPVPRWQLQEWGRGCER